MTKTEKEVTKGYIINGFKHFTQLATEYFPNHASCSSARKSMREKIDENLSLKSELEKADYTEHTIILSPKMQQIIWAHWGPPLISLPDSIQSLPNRIRKYRWSSTDAGRVCRQ